MSLLLPDVQKQLEFIRNAYDSEIQGLATENLPTERLLHEFLNTLPLSEKIFCLRISLIYWIASSKSQVPREMQLKVMIAECFYGKDVLVSAGTGSGKTLPVALGALYQDPTKNNITLVISPLKRLQSTQASDFESRYGLKSVAINEVGDGSMLKVMSCSCGIPLMIRCTGTPGALGAAREVFRDVDAAAAALAVCKAKTSRPCGVAAGFGGVFSSGSGSCGRPSV
ncbi:hypothetical protein BJ165DRAFT_1615690 [Panaeolus papilionaceus]|nr:hypothetical protein BJ165DRAFT_1615690 [Panaeolus papilionaceus]